MPEIWNAIEYLPEYFSVCICSVGTAKFPAAFGGQPFRFCCARRVWVACKEGPRGGTSGGAGSGGESLPVSEMNRDRICIAELCRFKRDKYLFVHMRWKHCVAWSKRVIENLIGIMWYNDSRNHCNDHAMGKFWNQQIRKLRDYKYCGHLFIASYFFALIKFNSRKQFEYNLYL